MKNLLIAVLLGSITGCASGPTKMEQVKEDLAICDEIGGSAYITQGLMGPYITCRLPKKRCTYKDFFDHQQH